MFAFRAGTPHSLVWDVDQHVKMQVGANYNDGQRAEMMQVGRLMHFTGI